jgi:hypothetical protein
MSRSRAIRSPTVAGDRPTMRAMSELVRRASSSSKTRICLSAASSSYGRRIGLRYPRQ